MDYYLKSAAAAKSTPLEKCVGRFRPVTTEDDDKVEDGPIHQFEFPLVADVSYSFCLCVSVWVIECVFELVSMFYFGEYKMGSIKHVFIYE